MVKATNTRLLSRRLHGELALAGAAGYVWCLLTHTCACGHMEHPPYHEWHYALDAGWGSCFLFGTLTGRGRTNPLRVVSSLLTLTVTASRLLCGSFFLTCLEVPAVAVLGVLALWCLLGPEERAVEARPLPSIRWEERSPPAQRSRVAEGHRKHRALNPFGTTRAAPRPGSADRRHPEDEEEA